MKKTILIGIVIVFIFVGPFIYGRVSNDYLLYQFAKQDEKILALFDGKTEVLGRDRAYVQSGNGEMCAYRFILAFNLYGADSHKIKVEETIKTLKLVSARERADGKGPEVQVIGDDHYYLIVVVDAAYDDLLDLRCW